ncbi:N-acetylmuramic acid 6-phosphate etherase [Anaeromyxobacter diazotrophicus]|uniref:N-acetylmuramic acid 6-phosphate etherase n=1 Tax=Anaeromyxobacter diazotrophicus TaxID=2590199 RepID=A0A7I9VNN5_9BACT|nr:N-acetylmuramic acid 6-phosphate etherase [Anaeromyxobacter diazotrophicus]GEJ58025.1 N-acetylmuramic acid 6-phosphate etherase [Anaeromyxobacter diazotrophicus]
MAGLPPTERLHPRSRLLDTLPPRGALRLLHEGDLAAARAVGRALPALARLAEAAARALEGGGRLLYAGAGTSGRLAAADAAECPPTFGVPRSRVVALVAGGAAALRRSVEGAEDDAPAGRAAVRRARVGAADLVVGVSASGTTPYVLAALDEARRRGAAVALLTCNPAARPRGAARAVLATGPELVAGSTRMAAGAATKMALALLSTGAMLRLGRVRAGRMIDVAPASAKLRRRAVRTVAELGRVGERRARAALARWGWSVRAALEELDR